MNIWLIQVGEPLPIDVPTPRLMRTGQMARTMCERGHSVTWWTSAFSHQTKLMRSPGDYTVECSSGSYRIKVIPSVGYSRHVSLRRFLDETVVARRIKRAALEESQPAVIIVSLPTLSGVFVAVRLARAFQCQLIVDVRDLWPDILVQKVPRFLFWPSKLVVALLRQRASRALRDASAVFAPSEEFVEWGVDLASRKRSNLDMSFPLAYEQLPVNEVSQYSLDEMIGRPDSRRRVVLFAGTLVPQFDFDLVLCVAQMMSDVDFVICGDGPLLEALRQKRPRNVQFTGWLGASDLRFMLDNADVGLAPYLSTKDFEGNIPNKIVEYLACGLPVVTSISGGPVAELLTSGQVGTVVSTSDAQAWCDAIRSWLLLLEDQNENASERCRQIYAARFDAREVALQITQAVEDLVGETDPRA